MPNIKLLIACCSSLSRIGLSTLLSKEKDVSIVKETFSIDDAITYFRKKNPDIILICFNLIVESGTNCVVRLKEATPGSKIIIINSSFPESQELKLFKQGVSGILKSNCIPADLLRAVRKVYAGDLWHKRGLTRLLFDSYSNPPHIVNSGDNKLPLSKRELDVLIRIAEGDKNNEIALKLSISNATIKTHVNNIFKKLEIKDRMQATLYALKHNLVLGK